LPRWAQSAQQGIMRQISVGGWTDSEPFYGMAASDESRQVFAQSCADCLKSHPQLDGTWEPWWSGIALSADQRWLLFATIERDGSDLMLVDRVP
jgi:hypothetical protein